MKIILNVILLHVVCWVSLNSYAQPTDHLIAQNNDKYGVIDSDSNWIIQPIYSSYQYLFNRTTDSITGYIFQADSNYVDIYDSKYVQLNHFVTEQYLLRGNYYNDGQQYLFLYNEKKLSIYCLFEDKWVIRDKPLKIWRTGACQQVKSDIYFFTEDFSNNLLVFDNLGQQLFKASVEDSIKTIPRLIKEDDQLLLAKTYFNQNNIVTMMDFQNTFGNVISVDEGPYSRDYSLKYHPKTKTFFLTSFRELNTTIYNKDFTFNRVTSEKVKTFDSFYASYEIFDLHKKRYKIYETTDSVSLSFTTSDGNGIMKLHYGSGGFAKTDSGYILLNQSTLSSPIKYYVNTPFYLGYKGLILMHKTNNGTNSIVDVYSPSGALILEDYICISPRLVGDEPRFYGFVKDGIEVWLTEEGNIRLD